MSGSRKSSLTPFRSSLAPTEKMRSSNVSSRKSGKKEQKNKSSMNLFQVKEENSLTAKHLTKLLKGLGINIDKNVKNSFGSSFEDLSKKGFKTKK